MPTQPTESIMMDQTTLLLSLARFFAAIARLCLGPLMPLLATELGFDSDAIPGLLAAYSTGYIVTQIGGGYLADKYGASVVISLSMGLSSVILMYLTVAAETAATWSWCFLCLGLVAGPLFPAGSAAISATLPAHKRAASAAMVDAAAAGGTTVAAMAPLIAETCGSWKTVYQLTALCLALVSVSVGSFSPPPSTSANKFSQKQYAIKERNSTTTNGKFLALLSPTAVAIYVCHSSDNLTKYTLNAWAATMLFEQHDASPGCVGTILALQEAIGVQSRLWLATMTESSKNYPTLATRGRTSTVAFVVQAMALYATFQAPTARVAAVLLVVAAAFAGAHSIGFKPLYLETSPEHSGSISGLGNTIASMASAIGPVLVGLLDKESGHYWSRVGLLLCTVNIGCGAAAALSITKRTNNRVGENAASVNKSA